MRRRLLVFGALTCLAVVLVAAPAAAKGGGGGSHDRRISLSGALVVAADEVVTAPVVSVDGPATITGRVNNDVFVGHGDLTVSGQVTGDVLVVDGNATITGRVSGDITDLHGRITVNPGANVHGDVTSMLVGGIAALLLQMLHPAVLVGVWEHSKFRTDMHGRLRRTARFIALTTYGSQAEAEAAIARVRSIHDRIRGTLPNGLRWKRHCAAPRLIFGRLSRTLLTARFEPCSMAGSCSPIQLWSECLAMALRATFSA